MDITDGCRGHVAGNSVALKIEEIFSEENPFRPQTQYSGEGD